MKNHKMKKILKKLTRNSESELDSSNEWDICEFPVYYYDSGDLITKCSKNISSLNSQTLAYNDR